MRGIGGRNAAAILRCSWMGPESRDHWRIRTPSSRRSASRGWSDAGFWAGKIPAEDLRAVVFGRLGADGGGQVLVGPRSGEDAAVLALGAQGGVRVAVSADPITGAAEAVGRLAVLINANDVACAGAAPRFLTAVVLLPAGAARSALERVVADMHAAAASLGVAIVGGHTELTAAVTAPVVVGTMVGELAPGVPVRPTASARAGDRVVLAKEAALEGAAILAGEGAAYWARRGVFADAAAARRFAEDCLARVAVVREAAALAPLDALRCMHDPTEGGVAGALHELADAAGTGFCIDVSAVPLHPVTRAMCADLDASLRPLSLISSGALLAVARPGRAHELIAALRAIGVSAVDIGELTADPNVRVDLSSGEPVLRPAQDELWRAMDLLRKRG